MSAELFPLESKFLTLAEALSQADLRHSQYQLINDKLCDVRGWRNLPVAEIARKLAADPLAPLAAWELTLAADQLRGASPSDAEYLRPFSDPALLQRLIYLGFTPPEGMAPELPRAFVVQRQSPWDALLFLHHIIRWAERFADWSGGRRELLRLLLNHPFPGAMVDEPLSVEEGAIWQALSQLGVPLLKCEAVAEHHFNSWLMQAFGLTLNRSKAKQRRLDFRQAGGTMSSIYVVRAMGGVDGVDVRGRIGEDLALIIDIGDREISVAATDYLEQLFVRVINEHTELSAEIVDSSIRLRWFDNEITAEDLGQIIHQALKEQFILGIISVNIIFDPLRIRSLRPSILAYREDRTSQLKKRTEDGSPFVVCTSCQSYAPHAFCIASADRPPCCGRAFDELATMAQLTRGREQMVIDKGICQDRSRGSYLGSDKVSQLCSSNNVQHLNLHSLRDLPHPTTAIPECVAYYMDDLDLICIISRDYHGRSPDGKTYETVLSRIAGRQVAGFIGISEAYILSPRFFNHEGGLSRVGWMNSSLKTRLQFKADQIATEKDCINVAGLKEFLAAWRH